MIERVAYLSFHTSPLRQPGTGNAGGMNVYIHELAQTMAHRGVGVDVFTRVDAPDLAPVVDVEAGYRVINIPAGPPAFMPMATMSDWVFDYAEAVVAWSRHEGTSYDLVHSHYWLSGWAGLLVKRMLGIPLANSFHTLGRVKDRTRRPGEPASGLLRIAAEHDVIAGSDCVIAATPYEGEDLLEHYGADPTRLCVSPPGLDHDLFQPGDRAGAREAIGMPGGPIVLFVGRIQPLKGADVAIEAFGRVLAKVGDARLVVVGGPSGPGGEAEFARLQDLVVELGVAPAVSFVPPRAHHELAAYYRAADVLLFPSRSESFGLVAAESQACGTPVIAARTGGLNYSVADGMSGFLIDGWDPDDYAGPIVDILTDPELAARLSAGAVAFAEQFSWRATADRLLELYDGITG